MSTQINSTSKSPLALRKLHSIHMLPNGQDFDGRIELNRASYQFAFAPKTAAIQDRKLTLTGQVTVTSPKKQKRTADKVEATLLATQGSVTPAPPFPRSLDLSLKTATGEQNSSSVITDATGAGGSVGVMYLRLSELNGKSLGLPMDLSSVQLNVRLYPTSETERDLQWLYSALVSATLSDSPDEQKATAYLAEINRILKAGSP
jgi:hypothetical protein